MSRVVLLLFVLILNSQCGAIKTTDDTNLPKTATGGEEKKFKEVRNLGSIQCDGLTYDYYSNAVGFHSLSGSKRICLRELAFQGDETANKIIAQIIGIHGIKSFVTQDIMKFRGPIVFQALLDQAGDHTLLRDTCNEIDGGCGATSSRGFMSTAGRLIDNIEGKSVGAYIDAQSGLSIDDMLIALNEHNNTYSKLQYRIIKDAWEKGLIKLKPYGEE